MNTVKNIYEVNELLARFVSPNPEVKYSLERMKSLMDFLGNPQNDLKIIHVAGTSGKTSTCYYLAALLKAAGSKVGHTVSPHVSTVNERLQINLEPLTETKFCEELNEFMRLIEKSNIKPSYFELLVALAYWEFAKERVDYAVIEVGLGGLLDGTNVISRDDKVCVITDIGFDHVNILGHSLREIAAQKAGIIQPKNEVFTYRQVDEVLSVIQGQCNKQRASLHVIETGKLAEDLDFLPLFQQHNFGLAKAVVDYVLEHNNHSPLSHQQLLQAAQTYIPARMEIFKRGHRTIILDGAHNAQKLHALIESIKAKFPDQAVAVMVSFADGRGFRLESSFQELAGLANSLIITAFSGGQDLPHGAVDPDTLTGIARQQGFATIETVKASKDALKKLFERPEPILLITGSFFIMNEVRPLVQSND